MQAVVFIGVQATGKSTFYKQRFVDTHIRINGDMLKTKHREKLLVEACLAAKQAFVVDKVNAHAADRARYIEQAKQSGFKVTGYYFRSVFAEALARNDLREGRARVSAAAIGGTLKRLQIPTCGEGFDELFFVWINEQNEFVVEDWKNDV